MDDSIGESEFSGWRSSEEMELSEEMVIETTEEMAEDKTEEENISVRRSPKSSWSRQK